MTTVQRDGAAHAAAAAFAASLALGGAALASDRSFEDLAACDPVDVSDAVRCVADHAPHDAVTVLRVDPATGTMTFDHFLRQSWRLNQSTPVSEAFRAVGVDQPGDMTRLILRAYLYSSSGCQADWNDLNSWRHEPPAGCAPIG